jgi:hypothetical protein
MIQAIRKYIGIIALALIFVLGAITYIQYIKVNSLKTELSISKSNEKAFIAENNGLKEENIAFKFTIDQLNYFNDSLTTKMNDVMKQMISTAPAEYEKDTRFRKAVLDYRRSYDRWSG